MSRLLVGTVALAFVALTTPTIAAKAPPPIYNWSGCYFGGNVGWTSAHTSGILNIDNRSPALGGPAPSSFSLGAGNTPSFIGGGQVGCNYQSGQFVFGIEGDADWRRLSRTGYLLPGLQASSHSESGNFSLTSKWQASLRGPDPAPIFPATGDLNVNSSEIIGKVNFRFNSNSQSTEPPPMRRNQ